MEALAEMIEACAPSLLAHHIGRATLLPAEERIYASVRFLAATPQEALLLEAFNAWALHESDRLVTGAARQHQRARFNQAYRKLLDKAGK